MVVLILDIWLTMQERINKIKQMCSLIIINNPTPMGIYSHNLVIRIRDHKPMNNDDMTSELTISHKVLSSVIT